MKKQIIFQSCFLFVSMCCLAQPAIQWEKTYGGSTNEWAQSVQQTNDGGYIVSGISESNDGHVTGNHGMGDYWIVKLDNLGNLQWQKCLGGTDTEGCFYWRYRAASVKQTPDSGYIITGSSRSNNGDVVGHIGGADCWVVKLDNAGNIQWQKVLGGTGDDESSSIQLTPDGGYIIAGYTQSNDNNVSGNHGSDDCWIVKLDNTGSVQWQKCYGGSSSDFAVVIELVPGGGYTFAGWTASNNGDVSGNHGSFDYWLVNIDSLGSIQWQKCFGGIDYEYAEAMQRTTDGGYILAGNTISNSGNVSGYHGLDDYWVIKTDNLGNFQWQKCFGGSYTDFATSIDQTTDGGYVVGGLTRSNNGDVTNNHSIWNDVWIIKLDMAGSIQWQKCYGGYEEDEAYSMQQTLDGGYIIAGRTQSVGFDVTPNPFNGPGHDDYWIVKLGPYTTGLEDNFSSQENLQVIPNPVSLASTIYFTLQKPGKVTVSLVDVTGKLVKTISDNHFETGKQRVEWNTNGLGAGLYFLQVQTEGFSRTEKVVITK